MPLTQQQLQAIPVVRAPSYDEAPAGAEPVVNHLVSSDGIAGLYNFPIAVEGGQPVNFYQLSGLLRDLAIVLSEAMDAGDRETIAALTQSFQAAIAALQSQIDAKASPSGINWSIVNTDREGAANNGYIANATELITITLPATAALGSVLEVVGISGNWQISQREGQQIFFGNSGTATGVTGRLNSGHPRDSVRLICIATDAIWQVASSTGNLNLI